MTLDEARKLAARLRRETGASWGCRRVTVHATVGYDSAAREHRVLFSGSPTGEHSLSVQASSPERILAHWRGYVEGAGLRPLPEPLPEIGELVRFPSASASRMGGWRTGRIESIGPKRARISFTYRTTGRKSEAMVPLAEIRFDP